MFQRYVTGMMDEISYLLMGFYVFRTCSIWMIYTQCVCSPMVEQDERVGHASSMVVSMNESVIWIGLWNIYRCYRSLIALLRSCQSLHVQPTTLLAQGALFLFFFFFCLSQSSLPLPWCCGERARSLSSPASPFISVVGRQPEVCVPQGPPGSLQFGCVCVFLGSEC